VARCRRWVVRASELKWEYPLGRCLLLPLSLSTDGICHLHMTGPRTQAGTE